jgi:hypothetical protein
VELLGEVEFPDFAGGFALFGVLEGEVGEDDPGEGVVAGGQLGARTNASISRPIFRT